MTDSNFINNMKTSLATTIDARIKSKIENKVDKEEGKQLSTEDYSKEDKAKLASIIDMTSEETLSILKEVLPSTPSTKPSNYYNKEAVDEKLGGLKFWKGNRQAYDAIREKDPQTIYFVTGA